MFAHIEMFRPNFSSLSFANRVNLLHPQPYLFLYILNSLVFFFLSKLLFSGYLQFKGNSVRGQNN